MKKNLEESVVLQNVTTPDLKTKLMHEIQILSCDMCKSSATLTAELLLLTS